MSNFTKFFSVLFCLAAGLHLFQCLSNTKNTNIRKSSRDGSIYISSDSEPPIREGRILKPPIFIPINIPGWVPPPNLPVDGGNGNISTTTPTTTTPNGNVGPGEGDGQSVAGASQGELKKCKKSCCLSVCIYAGPQTNLGAICTGDANKPCNLEISNLAKCHNSALAHCLPSKCSPRSSCSGMCADILAWGSYLTCS